MPACLLRKPERALPASSSLIPLNPVRPKRERAGWRWGVVVNEGV